MSSLRVRSLISNVFFVKSQPRLFEWSTRIWLICKFPNKLFRLSPQRSLINQQLKEINTYINSVRNMLSSIARKIEVWSINWLHRKALIKTLQFRKSRKIKPSPPVYTGPINNTTNKYNNINDNNDDNNNNNNNNNTLII